MESQTGGRRLVVSLYVGIVLLTAGLGFVIGVIAPQDLDPELFGFIQLPPTPVGMAVYGGVTIATLLGVLLLGVVYVSGRYDDAEPRA
jgi:Mg/Co/Ni transporter MgtE